VSRERGERGGELDRGGQRSAGREGGQVRRSERQGMERLGDLLPEAARQLGLDEQLEQAEAIAAWQRILTERVPAAVGSCRLVALVQGVATVEADQPIVAQELRLRAPELMAALRSAVPPPVRQLRITARHV